MVGGSLFSEINLKSFWWLIAPCSG
jgi:hypothetical protein